MRVRIGRLVAFDGINGAALLVSAHEALVACQRHLRGGVSRWDASGVFEELTMADANAGTPSARTLLLLYAADLAFRVRWEIRPAVEEGRTVIAAPYVDTAVAFGRAAGVPSTWLSNLFRFAPRPVERHLVDAPPSRAKRGRDGFVEVVCERWADRTGITHRHLIDAIAGHLIAAHTRHRRRPP